MSNLAKVGIGFISAIAWYFIAFSSNFFENVFGRVSVNSYITLFLLFPALFLILGRMLIKKKNDELFWIDFIIPIAWYVMLLSSDFFDRVFAWVSAIFDIALLFLFPVLFVILGCILIKKKKWEHFWMGFIIPHALFFGWALLAIIIGHLIGFGNV